MRLEGACGVDMVPDRLMLVKDLTYSAADGLDGARSVSSMCLSVSFVPRTGRVLPSAVRIERTPWKRWHSCGVGWCGRLDPSSNTRTGMQPAQEGREKRREGEREKDGCLKNEDEESPAKKA